MVYVPPTTLEDVCVLSRISEAGGVRSAFSVKAPASSGINGVSVCLASCLATALVVEGEVVVCASLVVLKSPSDGQVIL
jgi:hypothetical protein